MGLYPLSILAAVAAVAVALVFLVAGIDKLRHRELLPGVIANYRLLPPALVTPAAALLPLAELAVAAGLLAGVWQPAAWAPLAAIALLLTFAAAMAINIGRGRRHIDCGCGHAG
ncbi:MauE/DoxX family redox-associated membrane protein, partial [Sandarakinorhabdus rubra]|uniref:MauE/DoxX family redox-associated membrane protein n=1 Tax=Sandarakinorhabdus rubra TaxID=2672568 RepID=UPI002E2B80B2